MPKNNDLCHNVIFKCSCIWESWVPCWGRHKSQCQTFAQNLVNIWQPVFTVFDPEWLFWYFLMLMGPTFWEQEKLSDRFLQKWASLCFCFDRPLGRKLNIFQKTKILSRKTTGFVHIVLLLIYLKTKVDIMPANDVLSLCVLSVGIIMWPWERLRMCTSLVFGFWCVNCYLQNFGQRIDKQDFKQR